MAARLAALAAAAALLLAAPQAALGAPAAACAAGVLTCAAADYSADALSAACAAHGLDVVTCCDATATPWATEMCSAEQAPWPKTSDLECGGETIVAKRPGRVLPSLSRYECGFRPDDTDYWLGLAGTGTFCYFIAALVLTIAMLRILLRLACCAACQGFLPKPREGGYTAREVLVPKMSIFIFGAVAIFGALLVYAGGSTVDSELNSALDAVQVHVDAFDGNVNTVNAALLAAVNAYPTSPYADALETNTGRLLSALEGGQEDVDAARSKTSRYIAATSTASLAFGSFVAALSVLSFFFTMGNYRSMFNFLIPAGVLVLFSCWIIFGALSSANLLADDLCQAIDQYADASCDTCAAPSSYLQAALPCPSLAQRTELLSAMRGWNADAADYANTLLDNRASDKKRLCVNFCAAEVPCATSTLERLLPSGVACGDGVLDLSQENVTQADIDAEYADAALADVKGVATTIKGIFANMAAADSTSSCTFALHALLEHKKKHCGVTKGLGKSLMLLWAGFGLVAVAFTFAVIAWIIGQRRFGERGDMAEQGGKSTFEADLARIAQGGDDPTALGQTYFGDGTMTNNPIASKDTTWKKPTP